MWFPNEIFSQIKDYMLNYKYTFSRKILPLIIFERAIMINSISPKFPAGDYGPIRYIYEISYTVPRYSYDNMSEYRLNKLGLTHYGPSGSKKNEKRYMYLREENDWLNLEGYKNSRYYDKC
jgi:hypothetical protein